MVSLRESRARDEQAARMRACRYTWQVIADALGYRSRQAAHLAVARHYSRTRETPEFARRSLADGLGLVMTTLFEELAQAKTRGDVQALATASREIRLATRELANLDGLHAPQQVDVDVKVNVGRPTAEILKEYQNELLAAMATRRAATARVVDADVIGEIEQ